MKIEEISVPIEWLFFAEGGAHIVFRYTGDRSLLIGKVLRIDKTDNLQVSNEELINNHSLWPYVDRPVSVQMPKIFLEELLHNALRYREPKFSCALCFAAVKVDRNSELHFSLCRFCNQNYDLDRTVSGTRRYCPADLLSGKTECIKLAIDSLCLEPRNNFQVYMAGRPIESWSLDRHIIDRIVEFLASDQFLYHLSTVLEISWRRVFSLSVDHNDFLVALNDAAVLRDCSFIMRISSYSDQENVSIRMIDLDTKPKSKMKYYLEEVRLMKVSLHSVNS